MKGYIQEYNGEYLTICVPYTGARELIEKQITECDVILNDGRRISDDQRKKIYATFRDISNWTGYDCDEVKHVMKFLWVIKTGNEEFSLSDVDMTTASDFLSFLIDFCVEHGIPCSDRLSNRTPDIERYIYTCLIQKKCCVCGQPCDLHHVDRIGMGRDRTKINHIGMRAQPLCRKHHDECHMIGQPDFDAKYHICAVEIDSKIAETYKVKGE